MYCTLIKDMVYSKEFEREIKTIGENKENSFYRIYDFIMKFISPLAFSSHHQKTTKAKSKWMNEFSERRRE